jgi:hypothetical protein
MARVGRANRAGFEVLGMIFGWPDRAAGRGAPTVAICWKHSASTDLDPFCHHSTVFQAPLRPFLSRAVCYPSSKEPISPLRPDHHKPPTTRSQTFLFGDLSGSHAPRSDPSRPVGGGNMSGSSVLR